MKDFLKKNEKAVSVAIISFAVGFGFSLVLMKVYAHSEIIGNFCARTAEQAQAYFNSL
ncbi:MAG: hypothetical protein V4467_03940 [Patescibacteria group bacterium]